MSRKNRTCNYLTYSLIALLLAIGVPSAQSQEIEEIVVTAQKRSENIQDVPLAITAVSGEMLDAAGIISLDTFSAMIPSVTFTEGSASGRNNSIRIRGIGTDVFNIGVEPSVAVFLDGVLLNRPAQGFNELADIDRIEVLRGPQGTLFGKNTSAGGVHIITKRPSEEFEANASVTVAEGDEYRLKGSISAPINDNWGYRLSGFTSSVGDWVSNANDAGATSGLNGYDASGFRGKLEYGANDGPFNLLLIGDYSKKDSNCCARTYREFLTNPDGTLVSNAQALVNRFINNNALPEISASSNEVSADNVIFADTETWGISAEANWDLANEHTVTVIGSYRWWEMDQDLDGDGSPDPVITRNFAGGGTETTTLELRLASPIHDNYDYVLGAYFYHADIDRIFERTGGPAHVERDQLELVDSLNYALFGQINFRPTDQMTLLAGFRQLHEEQDWTLTWWDPGTKNVRARNGLPWDFAADWDESKFVYKLGAQYNWTDDVMTYLTYGTGYKGFAMATANVGVTIARAADGFTNEELLVDSETSKGWELGLKSQLWDNRAQLNVALYSTDYEGYQSTVFNPVEEAFFLGNADLVTTDGMELDFTILPTESLTITGGVAYVDAVFGPGTILGCYRNQGVTCIDNQNDVGGKTLVNSPELSYSLTARKDFQVGSVDAFAQAFYSWQDEVQFDARQDPIKMQDSYGILDLTLGMMFGDGRYRASFFVKNATDESFVYNIIPAPGNAGAANIVPRNFGRYFGVNFSADW